MSDFKSEIKTPTDKEKEEVFYTILTDYLQNGIIGKQFTKKEILAQIQENYGQMISQDEILATTNIAEQLLKMCVIQSYFEKTSHRKEFVKLIYLNNGVRKENVLILVNATVADIVGSRKYIKNKMYEFNVNHVIDIVNGKDPYKIHKEEFMAQEARRNFKIVK